MNVLGPDNGRIRHRQEDLQTRFGGKPGDLAGAAGLSGIAERPTGSTAPAGAGLPSGIRSDGRVSPASRHYD